MRFFALLPYYIRWHYGLALKNIGIITENFVWFFWHFFSIGLLVSTLFMPWQKLHEEKPSSFDVGELASTWIINILMRIAGAVIRLFMIVIGLVCISAVITLGISIAIIWLMLPFIILFSVFLGVVILINQS